MLIRSLALAALLLAVAASGIGVVWSRHQARVLFHELQLLQQERDELNLQWEQLQTERAMLAETSRVERIARQQLGLDYPRRDQVVVVLP